MQCLECWKVQKSGARRYYYYYDDDDDDDAKRCVVALSQVHWQRLFIFLSNQAITGCTSNTVASASRALERSTVSEPRLLARS